jgi:hypothetical protein
MVSKLQTTIALSTIKSIKDLHNFASQPKQAISGTVSIMIFTPSKVYGDNTAYVVVPATTSATFHPLTSNIAIKWHHFRDQVLSDTCK